MGFNTGWSFEEEWAVTPEDRQRLSQLLSQVVEFWGQGKFAQGKSLEEDVVFGRPLADAYKAWIYGCEGAKYHRMMLEVYDGNIDEFLYKTLCIVSYAIAFSWRCQWDYEWGAGNSGKDLQHCIVVAFLGDSSKGGYTQLIQSSLLTSTVRSDPNGAQSFKHACVNKRYVYFNEQRFDPRTKDRFFNDAELKELSEQEGTGVQTRTLYALPETWKPMCGIVGAGNPPLPLSAEQCSDTGTRRRIAHSKMPRQFTLEEDKDLKKSVNEGVCNAELFFLCKMLWGYVDSCGKRIEPLPPRMRLETQQILNQDLVIQIKAFIELRYDPVDDTMLADSQVEVRKTIGEAFPAIGEQCEAMLKKCGVEADRSKKIRYYTYTFPGDRHPRAMKYRHDDDVPAV
jgi:hypothetical protein